MTKRVKLTEACRELDNLYHLQRDKVYEVVEAWDDGKISVSIPHATGDYLKGLANMGWRSDGTWILDDYEYDFVVEKDDKGAFAIWSRDSGLPPGGMFYSYKLACEAASKKAEENGGTYYVLRAECKYTATTGVVKEEL